MAHERKPWVTPQVTTRLTRQIAERPDLLEKPELQQTLADLRRLENMLRQLDAPEADDAVHARLRADALSGMARHWRKLNRYLDG